MFGFFKRKKHREPDLVMPMLEAICANLCASKEIETQTAVNVIKIMNKLDTLTAALNEVSASIVVLSGQVEAVVAELGNAPTEAQIAALTQTATGLKAAIDVQSNKLTAALNPTTPAATVTPPSAA